MLDYHAWSIFLDRKIVRGMDLSIRKPQQSSAPPSSKPILNPPAPVNILQNPPIISTLPPMPASSVPSLLQSVKSSESLSIHQQNHQYVPIPPAVQQQLNQVQQRMIQQTKYSQLLSIIEEMSKDIKPTYAGNKTSAERLRRAIASARILVRELQIECDRNSRS